MEIGVRGERRGVTTTPGVPQPAPPPPPPPPPQYLAGVGFMRQHPGAGKAPETVFEMWDSDMSGELTPQKVLQGLLAFFPRVTREQVVGGDDVSVMTSAASVDADEKGRKCCWHLLCDDAGLRVLDLLTCASDQEHVCVCSQGAKSEASLYTIWLPPITNTDILTSLLQGAAIFESMGGATEGVVSWNEFGSFLERRPEYVAALACSKPSILSRHKKEVKEETDGSG